MAPGPRNPFENFRIEVDPEKVDEAVTRLRERLDALRAKLEDGVHAARWTKVRISSRGKTLLPDLPLSLFLAGEGIAFAAFGPLYAVLGNLGVRALLEVEFIHDADELVLAGQDAYLHGEVETAEARYREALERRKDDPSAMYHLGVLLRVTGRRDEAMEAFRTAAMGPEGHADVIRAAETLARLQDAADD